MMEGLSRIPGVGAYAVDSLAVTFGLLFAVIWGLSALYAAATVARGERVRFFAYFLLAAIGGVAVAFAADAVSFYLCFALMALPTWGLVTHAHTPEAQRAGTIYLTVAVLGEALLLAALMLLTSAAGSAVLADLRAAFLWSPNAGLAFALVVAAFALKIGAILVSGILPLTYTYTPPGAAVALAGASTTVGVLGLLRLLPLGEAVPESWGAALVVLGLATVFGAALLGVLTTLPASALGYSSASQMGFVLVACGMGLLAPEAGAPALAAATAYALHHGLAKAALFAGEDVVRRTSGAARRWALAALALPALALTGLPLTSGFAAKYALKYAIHAVESPLAPLAEELLPWAAVGTALVMLRFFALLLPAAPRATRSRVPAALWGAMLVLVAGAVWLWPAGWAQSAGEAAFDPKLLWAGTWPVLVALAVALAAARALRSNERLRAGVVAPGDVLVAIARAAAAAPGAAKPQPVPGGTPDRQAGAWPRRLAGAETALTRWAVAAGVFLGLSVLLVLLAT